MQNEDYEEAARIKKLVKKEEAKASELTDLQIPPVHHKSYYRSP